MKNTKKTRTFGWFCDAPTAAMRENVIYHSSRPLLRRRRRRRGQLMQPDLLWVCESAAATVTSASATFSNGRIDGRTDGRTV